MRKHPFRPGENPNDWAERVARERLPEKIGIVVLLLVALAASLPVAWELITKGQ